MAPLSLNEARLGSAAPRLNLLEPTKEAVRPLRVALATLGFEAAIAPGVQCSANGCGLLAWCASARRLRRALPAEWQIELLAIQADDALDSGIAAAKSRATGTACPEDAFSSRDCPEMRRLQYAAAARSLGCEMRISARCPLSRPWV